VLIVAGGGFAWRQFSSSGTNSAPTPAPVAAFSYLSEGDAAYLAGVTEALAERVAADGQTAAPKIDQRGEVMQTIQSLGQLATAGRTAGKYPHLPTDVTAHYQPLAHFAQGGTLTAEDRATFVQLTKELAAQLAQRAA